MAFPKPTAADKARFEQATHVRIRPKSSMCKPFEHFAERGAFYRIKERFPSAYDGTSIRIGEAVCPADAAGECQYVHFSHLIPLVKVDGKFIEVVGGSQAAVMPPGLATALKDWRDSLGSDCPTTSVSGRLIAAIDKYLPKPKPLHATRADVVLGAIFEVVFDSEGQPLPEGKQPEEASAEVGLHYGTRLVIDRDDGSDVLRFKRADGGWLNGTVGGTLWVALTRLRRAAF